MPERPLQTWTIEQLEAAVAAKVRDRKVLDAIVEELNWRPTRAAAELLKRAEAAVNNLVPPSDEDTSANRRSAKVATPRPEPTAEQVFIVRALQALRDKLIDITKRNPLISFKHSERGVHVRLINTSLDRLAEVLSGENKLTVQALPDQSVEPEDQKTADFRLAFEAARLSDPDYLAVISRDDVDPVEVAKAENELVAKVRESLGLPFLRSGKAVDLSALARANGMDPSYDLPLGNGVAGQRHVSVLMLPAKTDARLRTLMDRYRGHEAEAGVHTLQLVLGFLQWKESPESDIAFYAPLLTLAVDLKKDGTTPGRLYSIHGRDEGLVVNMALHEMLRVRHDIRLPEIEEDATPSSWMAEAARVLGKNELFSLRNWATLAVLPFPNMAIWRDLNTESDGWPELVEHEQVGILLGGRIAEGQVGLGFMSDHPLDDMAYPEVPPLIFDADVSQHSALVDVMNGASLALEGPPGTGKSQTITNIIAGALAKGQKVLFVAEKRAALQVVAQRLAKAGLDPLVLELHSDKSTKTEVMSSIRRGYERKIGAKSENTLRLDDTRAKLIEQRDVLKRYSLLLRKRVSALDEPVGDLVWREMRLRGLVKAAALPRDAWDRAIPEAMEVTAFTLERAREILDSVLVTANAIRRDELESSTWRAGKRLPTDAISQQRVLDDVADLKTLTASLLTWRDEVFAAVGQLQQDSLNFIIEAIEPLQLTPDIVSVTADTLKAAIKNAKQVGDLGKTLTSYRARLDQLTALHPSPMEASEAPIREAVRAVAATEGTINTRRALAEELASRHSQLAAWQDLRARARPVLESLALDVGATTVGQLKSLADGTMFLAGGDEFSQALRHSRLLDDTAMSRLKIAMPVAGRLIEQRDKQGRVDWSNVTTDRLGDLETHASTLEKTGILVRPFSNAFKRAISSAEAIFGKLKTKPKDLAARMRAAIEWRREADEFASNPFLSALFATQWAGHESDFPGAINLVEAVQARELPFRRSGLEVLPVVLDSRRLDLRLWAERLAPATALDESHSISLSIVEERLRLAIGPIEAAGAAAAATGVYPDTALTSFLADSVASIHKESSAILAAASTESHWFKGLTHEVAEMELAVEYSEALKELRVDARIVQALLRSDSPFELNMFLSAYAEQGRSGREDLLAIWRAFETAWGIEAPVFLESKETVVSTSLANLARRLASAASDAEGLRLFAEIGRLQSEADELGAGWVYPEMLRAGADLALFADVFELALIRVILLTVIKADGAQVLRFGGAQLDNVKGRFRKLDAALAELEAKRILSARLTDQIPYGNGVGAVRTYTEGALLANEIGKQRRIIPIRDLVSRAGQALQAVKPVWMMSPTTVAQFVPPTSVHFDLIVIDEASQMAPAMAVGALARGTQIVVVGDPKQLPPSSQFQGAVDDAADDDDAGVAQAQESILDLAYQKLARKRTLKWHYRSRHESLIEFSNREFYERQLVVFPSASEQSDELGVRSIFANGVYSGSINEEEAKVVINEAVGLMINRPDLSLGIVTMNAQQREHLFLLFEHLKANETVVRDYLARWEDTIEPFFVKNLENVQGDERDIIIVSTLYGPPRLGAPIAQRFGLFTRHDEGHRRLNVLVTRAKRANLIVTSLRPNDVVAGPATSRGVQAFKRYLAYAEGAPTTDADQPGHVAESAFEEFVAERLRASGYEVIYQVGVDRYRIDLGIRHPAYPGGYLAGVECDGASYHSHYTVRDRDRIRQSVLEDLGWKIWRVWSTDWFNNPDREFGRLLQWLARLRDEASARFARASGAPAAPRPDLNLPNIAPKPRAGRQESTVATPVLTLTPPRGSTAVAPSEQMQLPLSSAPAAEPDPPTPDSLPPSHAEPPGPSGRKHEVDGIAFYEDPTLQGYYEVWSETEFVGSIERIGGSVGPAKMFGGNVRTSLPEYRGTREWDGGSFISKDIYSAVRRLSSEWDARRNHGDTVPSRTNVAMDWFERITGFREGGYEENRSKLQVTGDRLCSLVNGRSYQIGRLELVSLAELRHRIPLDKNRSSTTVRNIVADVRALHREPEAKGALFQVASQFNLLEMTSPSVTPQDGVSPYANDPTQGPACAIAAGAATIYRNYFAPVGDQLGQTSARQLDALAKTGEVLCSALGRPVSSLWEMRNGYALCSRDGLASIANYLRGLTEEARDHLRAQLQIGLHADVEITDDHNTQQCNIVTQAFCSALPLGYCPSIPAVEWEPFACLILEAAYESTLLAAVENADRTGSRVVFLTRVGGGVFANDEEWIDRSILRALNRIRHQALDVRLVSYGTVSPRMAAIAAAFP